MAKKKTNLEKISFTFPKIKEELKKELTEVLDYYDGRGYNTQTLFKNIFPAFVEAGLSGDLLKRTLKIRDLKHSITEEKHILMRGKTLGKDKWNEYCNFQSKKNTKEYKKEKYGWTDEDFDNYNKSRSVTIENCIRRHGEKEGKRVYNAYVEKQRTNGCSLDWFQNKLGIEEGKLFYETMNAKKAQTLENFITRYGKTEGSKKYLEYMDNVQGRGKLSKSSQELFWLLESNFDNECYFGEKNKEFGKYDVENSRYYYYDFVIPELKVVVEFNGDDWHANPEIYENIEWKHPFGVSISKEEIWEYDKIKKERIEKDGFKVFYIWEKAYLKDKEVTLNKLKDGIIEYAKEN